MVQGFDLPVPTDQGGERGEGDASGLQAGDGVDGLGVQGIAGDHDACQVESTDEQAECGDLVVLGLDLPVGRGELSLIQHCGEQMNRTLGSAAAAQGLAVHRQPYQASVL